MDAADVEDGEESITLSENFPTDTYNFKIVDSTGAENYSDQFEFEGSDEPVTTTAEETSTTVVTSTAESTSSAEETTTSAEETTSMTTPEPTTSEEPSSTETEAASRFPVIQCFMLLLVINRIVCSHYL